MKYFIVERIFSVNKGNITVYDIAREAKVSPATVSRVLTGNARVAEDKRKRIEEVIEKYNFQPNAVARSLFTKESKIIGFILPDITNPFFASTFMEAEIASLKMGYTMMLCNTLNRYENEVLHLKTMSERQVDAIILMGGSANDAVPKPEIIEVMNQIMRRTPIILINGIVPGVDCHRIVVEEAEGIHSLVDYLVSLGHKEIGMIGGIKGITSTDIKLEAFSNALQKHDIRINQNWIIQEGFDIESGNRVMKKLLENEHIPSAVIAISDSVASGAMKAANSAGLNIPKDISITGFDGTYIANITNPSLTTVSQNYSRIGEVVTETIIDVINDRETEKTKIINTKLIIQDSCLKI